METSNKVYKVTYEEVETGEQYTLYVEAASSRLAGEGVLKNLGKDYDLIQSRNAKPSELN